MRHADLSEGLAAAFLAGAWTETDLQERGRVALGARPRWLAGVCRRVLARFVEPPGDLHVLATHLDDDERFRAAKRRRLRIRRAFFPEPQMQRVAGPPGSFGVPALATTGALAAALELTPPELEWFADLTHRNRARSSERLRHYRYRWIRKRSGGFRLLETPKPRLKRIQRWLVDHVLMAVPPDGAAHGFVPGRSPLTFIAPHVGRHVVLRLDLEDFFASIAKARVRAMFLRVGYPYEVAAMLAGLCCVPTPEAVLRNAPERSPEERHRAAQRLRIPHLPQGAPTSPALSNAIAFRLDRRLSGLAKAAGAAYTRYADDLAFSGDRAFERGLDAFVVRVGAIALEEGFRLRWRKQRLMRRTSRQRLAGLVVNERANVPRADYDALRALLYNAVQYGPESQNCDGHPTFRAHLEGRISWVTSTNPKRGARLRALFERITWPDF